MPLYPSSLQLHSLILSFLSLCLFTITLANEGFCSAPSFSTDTKPLYYKVTNPTLSPSHLQDLPGYTRSVYKRDHAFITPESHVFSPLPDWTNTLGAYLISPAMGSHFAMYLAKMQGNSRSGLPPNDVERFIFVLHGTVALTNVSGSSHKLMVDSFAYLPPSFEHLIASDAPATLAIFERRSLRIHHGLPFGWPMCCQMLLNLHHSQNFYPRLFFPPPLGWQHVNLI